MTFVDRQTRCLLGYTVTDQVSDEVIQRCVDDLPQAHRYCSDKQPAYGEVSCGGALYQALSDKSQTYSVEGNHAALRHYLARLARRSRCFSRSLHALQAALRLFVFCWNQRQLYQQRFPHYPAHLIDFLCLCFLTLPEG